jgi:hypothetical protein
MAQAGEVEHALVVEVVECIVVPEEPGKQWYPSSAS